MTLQQPPPTTVVMFTPEQLEAIREGFRTFVAGVKRMAEQIGAALEPLMRRARAAANDPAAVAGLEGKYAVRAGLDPLHRTPEALDQLVMLVMAGDAEVPGDHKLRLLTRESRSLVAAAAIRGWCHSYDPGPAILAWHRLLGTTAVVVTRG